MCKSVKKKIRHYKLDAAVAEIAQQRFRLWVRLRLPVQQKLAAVNVASDAQTETVGALETAGAAGVQRRLGLQLLCK